MPHGARDSAHLRRLRQHGPLAPDRRWNSFTVGASRWRLGGCMLFIQRFPVRLSGTSRSQHREPPRATSLPQMRALEVKLVSSLKVSARYATPPTKNDLRKFRASIGSSTTLLGKLSPSLWLCGWLPGTRVLAHQGAWCGTPQHLRHRRPLLNPDAVAKTSVIHEVEDLESHHRSQSPPFAVFSHVGWSASAVSVASLVSGRWVGSVGAQPRRSWDRH